MARRSVLITLGSVLVISGWLLVLRHRYSASVFRPLTVLGLAAAGFALYAFFHAPPRHVVNRTQRMKVARASDEPARQIKDLKRAKRPSSRLQASAVKNLDELPPRAGEIPVSAELAQAAAPPAVAPDVPTDPAATPAAEKTAPADSNAPANPPAAQDPPAVVPAPAPQAAPLEVAPAVVVPSEIPLAPATTPAPGAAGERPAWLEISGQKDGSIYRTSVKSGLYAEIPECEHALEEAIQREVDHYIDKLVGEDGAAQLVNVPRSYLLEHVKKAEYTEIQTRSVGPMHQIHALLEIDNNAKEEFKRRWRDAVVSDRLWYVGSGGAVVLAMLATFWGYLKLDLHTGGLQSGRLQLAAALVALIVAAGAVLFRWAVPF